MSMDEKTIKETQRKGERVYRLTFTYYNNV